MAYLQKTTCCSFSPNCHLALSHPAGNAPKLLFKPLHVSYGVQGDIFDTLGKYYSNYTWMLLKPVTSTAQKAVHAQYMSTLIMVLAVGWGVMHVRDEDTLLAAHIVDT
ncbi:hypothetical protein BDQ17DRAFT_1337198 [Cyathus striatus]|nr:hypothetical protein BDQ17DRAFT_1337198 [Cyathus striatus]